MKRIDETKLTDYVMGELDAAARAEVEAAMAEDEQLRTQCEELQRTLNLLKEPQLQPVLGQDRREALRAAAREPQKGRLLQFPGIKFAAALLVFGGALVLWSEKYGAPGYGPETSQSASLSEIGYSKGDAGDLSGLGYSGSGLGGEMGYADTADSQPLQSLGYAEDKSAPSGDGVSGRLAKGVKDGNERGAYKGPGDSVPRGSEAWNFDGDASQPVMDLGVHVLAPDAALPAENPTIGHMTVPGTPGTPSTPGRALPEDFPLDQFNLSPSNEGLAVLSRAENLNQAPLESLGYASEPLAEDAEETTLDFRGLGNDTSTGSVDDLVFNDFGDDDARAKSEDVQGAYERRLHRYQPPHLEEPICTLTDGYGRRYIDAQVIEHLHPAHPQESPQEMFFRFYGDNPEVFSRFESLSTFAADVDTASYPMARNYLVNDQLPPKAAIRTEEFVNYFDYDLPAPTEEDFTVHLNASQTVFGDERLLVSIGIKAREVAAAERKPMNLVFVIDKSGSMAGERMQLVKDALMLLVDQIRDTDTIGLVTFDSTGHVVLESTPGSERYLIRKAIRSLSTGGSTNAGQGLELGYGLMEKVYDPTSINRVVLASDGVANTGETNQARILKRVTARAEAKVDLTTLGVGMGNHNDVFLEQLADQGNGSCHYLDDVAEAERVLVEGFLGTIITVARDVKIQVEFEEEQVLRWRQLGYENRSLAHKDFRNDAVDAGEVGSGHEVVALYEVQAAKEAAAEGKLVTVRLRWKPEGSEKAVERSFSLDFAAASGRWALAPVRLRQQAVVAQYAEVLRRSVHSRTDSYELLVEEATRLVKELSGESEVTELRDMIRRTRDLARWTAPDDRISMLVEEARRQRLLEAELALAAEELDVEDLLHQVRQQNRDLEGQLQEILQRD